MGLGPIRVKQKWKQIQKELLNTEVLHKGAGLSIGVPLSEKALSHSTTRMGDQITLSSDTHTQDLAT